MHKCQQVALLLFLGEKTVCRILQVIMNDICWNELPMVLEPASGDGTDDIICRELTRQMLEPVT